jgi:hypothetical protein
MESDRPLEGEPPLTELQGAAEQRGKCDAEHIDAPVLCARGRHGKGVALQRAVETE